MSIKVLIQKRKFSGGPSIFRERISIALNKIKDIQVVRKDKEPFDLELSVIRLLSSHNKPQILRADGCYYIPKQLRNNESTRHAMKKSSHIVYQSVFSKALCDNIIGYQKKPTSIIYNGIDLDYIKRIKPDSNIPKGSFVASAKWRENKRPRSLIKGFLAANTDRHLYILGDPSYIKTRWYTKYTKNIHLLGKQSPEKVISVLKACDYMIHLCFIDSCPNAVVEGLACGLNVLCTGLGGTREILKNDGIVLDVDKWEMRACNIGKIDRIDKTIVADGIHRLMKIKNRPVRDDLDISLVAEKYAEIIRKVAYKK